MVGVYYVILPAVCQPLVFYIMSSKKSTRFISLLYKHYLTANERESLVAVPLDDLSSEINLLRVLLSHCMSISQSAPTDLDSRMQVLHTCRVLTQQHAKLIRAQNKEHAPLDEWEEAIWRALTEVRKKNGN